MALGARSTVTSLVGVVALAIAQLMSAAPAAAQGAAPAPPPGYPPPQQGYPPPQQGYPPPQQGYPPPGYAPPPPAYYGQPGYTPYRAPRARRPKGMLIAGPIVLGVTYIVTAYFGVILTSLSDVSSDPNGVEDVNQRSAGQRLLIPLIGPWLAIPVCDGYESLCALAGLGQATGATLMIVGISRYAASSDLAAAADRNRLRFAFLPSAGGGFGMLSGRF